MTAEEERDELRRQLDAVCEERDMLVRTLLRMVRADALCIEGPGGTEGFLGQFPDACR